MVEFALAFPLLILVALALVQFALYAYAENVVLGAVQDGARVAAESDHSVSDGVVTARALIQTGLGTEASSVEIQGSNAGATVTITANGGLPTILPGVARVTLPLKADASLSKESFEAGPND